MTSDTPIGGRRARLRALRWPTAIRRGRFNGVFSRESRRSRLPSSMVEQWTFNPLVQGSSPWGGTTNALVRGVRLAGSRATHADGDRRGDQHVCVGP
jgi:hypothetical protein